MLIKHLKVPKNSQLQALREPTQQSQREEPQDYSCYMKRTLNPEIPIQDVLV